MVQFYIYWTPNYFHDVRHLSVRESTYFNSVTFIFGDLGSIGGGVAGGVSGIIFPYLTGLIVDKFSYSPVFIMASLMPMIGILILFATLGNYQRVDPSPRVGKAG